MADDSRIGMLKKFFPGVSSDSPATSAPRTGGDKSDSGKSLVKDVQQIQQIIEIAVTNGSAINVQIPGEKILFTTFFASTTAADFKTKEGDLCLLVSPLDPPMGNIKIRGAAYLNISFFTDTYIAEAKVNYIKFLEDRSIQLSFPKEVIRGAQKRSSARVKMDPKLNISTHIKRPAGFMIPVKIYDISTGGVAFYSEETIPPMLENTRVIFIISRPAQRDIEVIANVLGVMNKDGKTCYRTTFIHKGDSQKEVDKLIQLLIDKSREKRQKLFQS